MVDFLIPAGLVVATVGWLIAHTSSLKRNLHLLQLEDYLPHRMLAALIKRPSRLQLWGPELMGLFWIILATGFIHYIANRFLTATPPEEVWAKWGWMAVISGYFLWGFGSAWRGWRNIKNLRHAKKPLVMTSRARRIFWTSNLLTIIIFACILYSGDVYLLLLPIFYVLERTCGLISAGSVWLLIPVESSIQRRYLNDAKKILSEMKPLVIGITGSYGKTGTKELLAEMLSRKYNVFRPPGSYNTLMGITRVIRQQLRPHHEVMIVEMGAYRRGSIAKLCNLVQPKHGIITIVGVQHLERFGSQESIRKAKGELVQGLPPDGTVILNGDDPLSRQYGEEFSGTVVFFSTEQNFTNLPAVVATNVEIGFDGSSFDLLFPDGESISIRTPLLGRGAINNAAAAAAMADQLGVSKKSISGALANMKHVKHRLEPIRDQGGINVIDDAFNSNPIGAENALEVLSKATHGQRILVTPGMVELGRLEKDANYNFGKQAAKSCDLVVLVGSDKTEPIRQGLLEAGFPERKIIQVLSLNKGLETLAEILKPGDTMLLENDLPDQYE